MNNTVTAIRPLGRHVRCATWFAAGTLLTVHVVLLAWGALCHSPTFDEVGHLPAGLSHWEYGTFDLFRVNPPLIRSVAAAPVALCDVKTDWHRYDAGDTARSDFAVGQDFIAANGPTAFWYFTIARWTCIPFSLIGAVTCWMWAHALYGSAAGIIALSLWCFCPNVLAHGALLTPDVGAAALGMAASYAFWRWLKSSGLKQTVVAGILLGVAQLTKTTWLVLFPLWPVLWVVWCAFGRQQLGGRRRLIQAGQLMCILLVALYLLNMGYGFEGSFTPLGEYQFVSKALGGDIGLAPGVTQPRNRFEHSWIGALRVPVPKDYLLGIDHQKRNFEARFWSYLRGQSRQEGWYHYYLYGMLVKIPLGTWGLALLALAMSLVPRRCLRIPHTDWSAPLRDNFASAAAVGQTLQPPRRTWLDELALLAPAIAILVFVSSQTGINKHFRYVLPAVPYLFVWISRVGSYANFLWRRPRDVVDRAAAVAGNGLGNARSLCGALTIVLLTWSCASSLYIYPHSLSYFNESVGGPREGHWHLGTSNTDWGQDLFYLAAWYHAHADARPLHLQFGLDLVDPGLVGIKFEPVPYGPVMNRAGRPRTRNWHWGTVANDQDSPLVERPVLLDRRSRGPLPGWFAIGVNEIHDVSGHYEYFLEFEPVASAGYSTRIYHLTLDEVNQLRRRLALAPLAPDPTADSPPGSGLDASGGPTPP